MVKKTFVLRPRESVRAANGLEQDYIVDEIHDHGGDINQRVVVVHHKDCKKDIDGLDVGPWYVCNCKVDKNSQTAVIYSFSRSATYEAIPKIVDSKRRKNFDLANTFTNFHNQHKKHERMICK